MKLIMLLLACVLLWNLDDFIDAWNQPEIQRIEAQERVELIKLIYKSRDFAD